MVRDPWARHRGSATLTVLYAGGSEEPLLETEPTRMCALLVSLPDVTVVEVGEWPRDAHLRAS